MNWRVIVAGFIVNVGFIIGWQDTGTVSGAVFAAGFLSALFVAGWLIDRYVYGL